MSEEVAATTRAAIADAPCLVVKIGSSSLTRRGDADAIDTGRIQSLADLIATRVATGRRVVLVSSGAIAAGFPALGIGHRPRDLATLQAAASVGQGRLIAHYAQAFAAHGLGVGQVLLTADDVGRRTHYRNAQSTLLRLLELGIVPIVNENDTVATDEIRLGDNDRLAALVAHVVHADALLLLSDVDGLYDGPPDQGGSSVIRDVRGPADLEGVVVGGTGSAGVGLGGMSSKVQAASIATAAGVPVLITSADLAPQALAGDAVGTLFHATGHRPPTRLLWLGHAATARGTLRLDAGAVAAVTRRGSSLLAAGIIDVSGDFLAGDPVDLIDENGHAIARGLVNFDASELPGLLGRSTRDLAAELGPAYEREVVHRDDLVLLTRP
jgi:glutamate 5-kinase